METIRRREFSGSWIWFAIMFLSGFGIPFAVLYLIENTVEIETHVPNAEAAWEKIRAKKL
jgi:hypothetical protein